MATVVNGVLRKTTKEVAMKGEAIRMEKNYLLELIPNPDELHDIATFS